MANIPSNAVQVPLPYTGRRSFSMVEYGEILVWLKQGLAFDEAVARIEKEPE